MIFDNKIDKQLYWFANLFKRHNINYWIDSGTLLGIVRDGRLIKHDKDIDISVWSDQVHKLYILYPKILSKGYRIESYYYKECLFALKFTPIKQERLRYLRMLFSPRKKARNYKVIDICIFRKSQNYALNPQKHFHSDKYKKTNYKYFIHVGLKLLAYFYKMNKKITKIEVTEWPWKLLMDVGTWVIPYNLIGNSKFKKLFDMNVPNNYISYLDYRYGNWKVPVKNWIYQRDDNCYNSLPPSKFGYGEIIEDGFEGIE